MPRLLFEKTGNSVFISHLDLMRLFQRAFKRAGLPLKHTQGFNPRPSVSIALPLSVGVESYCELLDFELDTEEKISCNQILEALNKALINGVKVLEVYEQGRKIKDLALLSCSLQLEYDAGVPDGATDGIQSLFASDSLMVEKRSKNGIIQQDIIPMIRSLQVDQVGNNEIHLHACICCQNPTLNPMQMIAAIEHYLPEFTPSFSKCSRKEIFDNNQVIFR